MTLEVVIKNLCLSYSLVCIILLTSRAGIGDLVSGRINDLRVDHQSFDETVPEESLSANLSQNSCFASRINFTLLLRISLNFCQSLSKFDPFAFK